MCYEMFIIDRYEQNMIDINIDRCDADFFYNFRTEI